MKDSAASPSRRYFLFAPRRLLRILYQFIVRVDVAGEAVFVEREDRRLTPTRPLGQ